MFKAWRVSFLVKGPVKLCFEEAKRVMNKCLLCSERIRVKAVRFCRVASRYLKG